MAANAAFVLLATTIPFCYAKAKVKASIGLMTHNGSTHSWPAHWSSLASSLVKPSPARKRLSQPAPFRVSSLQLADF